MEKSKTGSALFCIVLHCSAPKLGQAHVCLTTFGAELGLGFVTACDAKAQLLSQGRARGADPIGREGLGMFWAI